jgi:hypothetical protein
MHGTHNVRLIGVLTSDFIKIKIVEF